MPRAFFGKHSWAAMSLEDDKERQDREWAEVVANDVFEFLAKESQKRDDFSFTASLSLIHISEPTRPY